MSGGVKLLWVTVILALLAACSEDPASTRAKLDASPVVSQSDPPALAAVSSDADMLALAREIAALGPSVDPEEAARAAQISYEYTAVLRAQYQITDPPLVHNFKVNKGLRPRGLCWHWAEDMEARLKAEGFKTLALHRAIANHDNVRIDHSTAIISAKDASMFDGVVVDPWRKGGELTWVKVDQDRRYAWRPRAEVLQFYRDRDSNGSS